MSIMPPAELKPPNSDPVNHPPHYNTGAIPVIDFLEDQRLEPHEWNAVKYICRAPHKGTRVQDLEKAIWYLKRKVDILTGRLKQSGKPTAPLDDELSPNIMPAPGVGPDGSRTYP